MAIVWVAVTYILIVLAIGIVMTKRGGDVGEFFVAGRQLSFCLLTPFIVSEFIGTMITVGNAEMAHSTGVATLWYFMGTAMGFPVIAFGLAKAIYNMKKITIAEIFGALFDQKTRLACAVFLILINAATLGATFLALGTILAPLLGIPYVMGVWLATGLMVFMAILGLKGVAWMNMIHFIVILGSFSIAAIASVNAVGGTGNLFTSLPPEYLDWWRPGPLTTSAWFMGAFLLRPISVVAIMAIFAAKDMTTAKVSLMTSGFVLLTFSMLPMLIGLAAYIVMPNIPSKQALWEMGRYCGPVISTLISLGVIAAIMSTTPGILLGLGGLACRDILLRFKPKTSDRAQITFSRVIIPATAIAGTWFALTQGTIYRLIAQLVQVQAILAVVLLISILWRRVHPTAALWTISLSCTCAIGWLALGSPFGIEPLWPGLTIGIVTLGAVSMLRPPRLPGQEGAVLTDDARITVKRE